MDEMTHSYPELYTLSTSGNILARIAESRAGILWPEDSDTLDITPRTKRQRILPAEISFVFNSSHACSINIVGVERLREGISKVTLGFQFNLLEHYGPFYRISVFCEAEAMPADSTGTAPPIKAVSYSPESADMLHADSNSFPAGRKPFLAVTTSTSSPAAVNWTFSQIDRAAQSVSTSQLPTKFQLSLTLEHSGDFKLNVGLDVMRLKWRFWKLKEPRQSAHVVINDEY